MSAVQKVPNPAPLQEGSPRPASGMVQTDRRFWIGLAGASLVHILIILGTLSMAGRRMGEPDASPEGVSVVIVDAADLKSRSTVPFEPPPSPPPQPQPAATPPPTPPSEQHPPSEPDQPPTQAEKSPRHEPLPDTPGNVPPPSQQRPQRPSKQAAAPRPANPAPAQKPAPTLDLTITPSMMMNLNRGGSFLPTRPPGITRSGENDEFGRGVIRALQRTIPQLMNTVGRVTVRIILNTKGNLDSVEVIRPSGIQTLDQSVIFAAKQSNFPIPPDNSTVIDRTFLVTYIYTVN